MEGKLGMHSFLPLSILQVLFLPFPFDSCPGCEVRVGPVLEQLSCRNHLRENVPTRLLVGFPQ